MRIRVQASLFPRQPLTWLANLLMAAGVVCLLLWGWAFMEGFLYQHFQDRQFTKDLQSAKEGDAVQHPAPPASPASLRQVSVPDTSPSALRVFPQQFVGRRGNSFANLFRADPELIGRLKVPRIDLSVLIREGVDEETLLRAAGHVPQTAFPGQPGDFVVLGHRDAFFRALRDIQRGDALRIQTLEGDFTYIVDALEVTGPDAILLDAGREPSATLITCYPFTYIGPAPRRFVVHARLASASSH